MMLISIFTLITLLCLFIYSLQHANVILEVDENHIFLWLGDYTAATNKNLLIKNGFVAILTVAFDVQIEPTEGIEHLAKGINLIL
jgi:hypothetical protein